MTMEDTAESKSSPVETINPSDLKAKFDEKMRQFAQSRNVKPKTDEDQEKLR